MAGPHVLGMVIHPAMVYENRGGVFARMYEDVERFGYVRVFGHLHVHWPSVHRMDLAKLYARMLHHGKAGDVFNASSVDGVAIGAIAQAISHSMLCPRAPVVFDVSHAVAEFGDWAEGYALDQKMSGQKAREQLGWEPEHVDVFKDIQ